MKIENHGLWSRIVTDNPDLIKTLRELYSFTKPGAAYSKAFKQGHWDGKKYFITPSGKFRTGLTPRLVEDLKRTGLDPEYEPLGDISIDFVPEQLGEFTLRDYQHDLVKASLTQQRGIIKAPTGAGKTLIMASILDYLKDKKIIIIHHQKQILVENYEFFKECGIPNLGICYGEGFIQGDIMLTTIQSIEKVVDYHSDAEVLMIDEVHEFASGKTTVAALEYFSNAQYRFGVTATVPKDSIKRFTLEGNLGPVIEQVSTSDLVEQGFLARPLIQMIEQTYPDLAREQHEMDYQSIYEKCIVEYNDRNNKIKTVVDYIKKNNDQARVMVLVRNLDHAARLEKLLDAYKLEGADSVSQRYKTINQFLKDEHTSVIIGTKIFQTGIDIKEITHFILARGLKSEEATLQAIGRSLRPNTETVYIYDFFDKDMKYLTDHARARLRIYKGEKHEVQRIKL